MEFWIGLSVGMHLGRVIAEYLEKLSTACGLLSPEAVKEIAEIEKVEEEVSAIIAESSE